MTGARWLTLGLCGLLLAAPLGASAEPKPEKGEARGTAREAREARGARRGRAKPSAARKTRKARPKREARRAKPSAEPERDTTSEPNAAGGDPKRAERAAPVSPAAKAAQDAAQGADSEIVKEGDTSVKVMSFSGLDIEGRLKSPQLLYFVNRVHAEFDRPKLPHRSFMPELERSTAREPIR